MLCSRRALGEGCFVIKLAMRQDAAGTDCRKMRQPRAEDDALENERFVHDVSFFPIVQLLRIRMITQNFFSMFETHRRNIIQVFNLIRHHWARIRQYQIYVV